MRIDPNLLVILAVLLKTRSVSNTAAQLKTSQPKISRALAQLRGLLDDPVLVRTNEGMTLTSRAQELTAPLQDWLSATDGLLEPQLFDPQTLARRFRVASTDYGLLTVVGPALVKIAREAPGVTIDIVPLKGSMVRELAQADVDLVVSGLDPDGSNLHDRFLFKEEFSCVFRQGHDLDGGDGAVALREFLAYPHIAMTVGEIEYDRIDTRLATNEVARHILARIPYFSAAPHLIGGTDAMVTLPARAARKLTVGGTLVTRPAPVEIGGFDYRLLWHPRSARDPALAWLVDLLARHCRHDEPALA